MTGRGGGRGTSHQDQENSIVYNQEGPVFEEIDKKIIGVVERLSAVSPVVVSTSNC